MITLEHKPRSLVLRLFSVVCVFAGGIVTVIGSAARQQPVQMQTKFDYSEHQPYLQPGENGIRGQGFLRQQGGGVVTCAGSEVYLFPATSFFREMMMHLRAGKAPQIEGYIDPTFKPVIKQSQCDAQGNFSFAKLPNGNWFIVTQVAWTVASQSQGGTLMREVAVSDNQTVQVLLTEKDFIGR